MYVANRGVDVSGKPFVRIQEQRPEAYLDSVAELLRSVVDGQVWHGDRSIRFDDSTLSELQLSERGDLGKRWVYRLRVSTMY